MDPFLIAGIALVVVPSITTHEAAHGFVADRLGDPTAREAGRLTLNPIPHIDPFMTILLPAFLILIRAGFIFGGAKPVPVNVARLRHPRRDWALVGAAGPLSNLFLAALLSALLAVALRTGFFVMASIGTEVLVIGIVLNVLLAVFNLIPIPPLDGSRVLQFFLSGPALEGYQRLERWGLLVVIGLVFFVRPFQDVLAIAIFGATTLVASLFGVSGVVAIVLHRLVG